MTRHITYTLALLIAAGLISLLFPRCANIVPPTGGPRDTIPPEVVRSSPPNYSTNFTDRNITIEFDEFIQLRSINQQFIITPPQKERPDFSVRGRTLYIDLRTDPIANATYTLNFGEGIVDLNEGNPLSNYEFVFSTSDIIDSLTYSGIVLNAYDNKPVEGVVVMMYDVLLDSVPFNSIPLYANRTGKDGRFRLNNLRSDTFLVFANNDENSNYLYDRPGEEAIAFRNELLAPDTLSLKIQETSPPSGIPAEQLQRDTLETEPISEQNNEVTIEITNNESPSDTLDMLPVSDPDTESFVINYRPGDTLFLFQEESGNQYLSRNERRTREELLFVFNKPLQEDWSIEPDNFEPPENWFMEERNPAMDSIRYWITDQEIRDNDRLRFLVTYWKTGPSDSLSQVSDTVNMNFTAPATTRRQARTEEIAKLVPAFNIREGGNQELNTNLKVSFATPLSSYDQDKISFTTIQNSHVVDRQFELVQDSLLIRNYQLQTDWVPGHLYRFYAEPGAFRNINGIESDTIDLTFTTREEDYYGSILLNLTGVDSPVVLQLLDEKDQVLREYFTVRDAEINIDFLPPQQNFRFKVIFDDNNNGKWDTGNYLKGIQPERVMIFEEFVPTRSNWEINEKWNLKE
ncbi:MAG: Ig-like domain-containing protein [Bacteroidales bacterium]